MMGLLQVMSAFWRKTSGTTGISSDQVMDQEKYVVLDMAKTHMKRHFSGPSWAILVSQGSIILCTLFRHVNSHVDMPVPCRFSVSMRSL